MVSNLELTMDTSMVALMADLLVVLLVRSLASLMDESMVDSKVVY